MKVAVLLREEKPGVVKVSLRGKGEVAVNRIAGRFGGRSVESNGGEYVEGTGGYRFRAVVDSAGHAELRFVRLGLW